MIPFVYFQVLVEFDDRSWDRREWIKIHDIFQIFLVENTINWALRTGLPPSEADRHPSSAQDKHYWPALVSLFRTCACRIISRGIVMKAP